MNSMKFISQSVTVLTVKFANLTQDVLMAFLKTCEFCSTKQSKAPKGIVVKPILSKEAFSRFQVDYIDLQSCPDETEYGTFKFILHGQDHLTKFTFLEATEKKICENNSPGNQKNL